MGRRKIQMPTRDEKEKVRKARTRLFVSAEKLSKRGVDVYVAVRFAGEIHYHTSCLDESWPLGQNDLAKAKQFKIQRKAKASLDHPTLATNKQSQSLRISQGFTSTQPAISLPSPPILQESPVDAKPVVPRRLLLDDAVRLASSWFG